MATEELQILISDSVGNVRAITAAKQLAEQAGFAKTDAFMIATSVSELATNIDRYATKGAITLRIVREEQKVGIEIIAQDEGPGIDSVENAMQDHFSTAGGLGLGLGSVKRIMDEFTIQSKRGEGTRISTRKWV